MAKSIKATIIDIIVALLIIIIIIGGINLFFGQKIEETISLINMVAVKKDATFEQNTVVLNKEKNVIEKYPYFGEKYATIEIPRIGVNLPVYFGDTMDILKKGVGHSANSFLPGEGGSIIYMGHNSTSMFRRFGELQKGDTIKVTTDYGVYNYEIYDMQIVKETEPEKLPIQEEVEILMVYTCYPFNNIGHAYNRYVVYAELIEE